MDLYLQANLKFADKYTKWIVLIAGIMIQTAIGGIYAWSNFVPSFVNEYGMTLSQTGMVFGLQVITFTIVTIPAGKLFQSIGPRLTASLGALLFGIGYVLVSVIGHTFIGLLLSLGLFSGTGIGLVYVCPLTTGMTWFPNNRGMVTGVTVAGFGIGAIVLSNFAEYLMITRDLSILEVFRYTGILFGGVALLSAQFLVFPAGTFKSQKKMSKDLIVSLLLSKKFIIIVLGMFTGSFSGLLLSAHMKSYMLKEGAAEFLALFSISLFAIGNTVGRLSWGMIHDKVGGKKVIALSLFTTLITMLLLFVLGGKMGIPILLILVVFSGFSFGSCFVVYPAAISDAFGVDMIPRLYPVSFLGYGIAAFIGPSLGGLIADKTGSFKGAFLLSAVLVFIALVIFSMQFKEKD